MKFSNSVGGGLIEQRERKTAASKAFNSLRSHFQHIKIRGSYLAVTTSKGDA